MVVEHEGRRPHHGPQAPARTDRLDAQGWMHFRLGTERRTCGPGDVVVIPGGVEHEAFFPEDTEVIDVFPPPREDFLAGGTPDCMKVK